jgi:outer membrane murein-binding lipoprotein Lpp
MKIKLMLIAAVAAVLAVAGCGGQHHAAAKASALATSSQGQAAKADLKKDAAQCQPKGTTQMAWLAGLLAHQRTRDALYNCAGVSKAQRPAAGKCVVAAAEKAVSAKGTKAARETTGINDLNGCVK